MARTSNLLDTRKGRFIAFGLLYVSEGIPYGFSSTALVAFMRQQDLSLTQIGTFVAALFIPWAFKWAWAPVVDVVKLNRFGGRRAWILFCTTMMIITLVMTALIDFTTHYQLLLVMVVLNNLFCATQDVAIDSLAVSTLLPEERGRGNGIMFGAQYLGIALGGGIFVFGLLGFNAAILFISALLALCWLFVVLFIFDPDAAGAERRPLVDVFGALGATLVAFCRTAYASFFRAGRAPRIGLLVAVLPTGAMALGYAILGTLQVDYGLSNNQIAELSVYSTVLTGTGCLLGGLLGDRIGVRRAMAFGYALTAAPTVWLGLQIAVGGLDTVAITALYSAVLFYSLFFGIAFSTQAAVFMGMTNPAIAATQFTAYMAMGNLAISIANYWQGIVAERFGYAIALYIDAALVALPLALIPLLRSREENPELAAATLEPAID